MWDTTDRSRRVEYDSARRKVAVKTDEMRDPAQSDLRQLVKQIAAIAVELPFFYPADHV